jgi:hypothetical protein
MKPFTTAPVVAHDKLPTDQPNTSMDTFKRACTGSNYEMEPSQHGSVQEGDDYGHLEIGNLETETQS